MSSPAKSLRARMGSAVRRSSSVISFGLTRSSTPPTKEKTPSVNSGSEAAPRKSSSATSLADAGISRQSSEAVPRIDTIDATLTPPPASQHERGVPSPIAESPAREAASADEDVAAGAGPSPLAQEIEPSHPPRLFETSAGPGAFTDEPDQMGVSGHAEPSVEAVTSEPMNVNEEERLPERMHEIQEYAPAPVVREPEPIRAATPPPPMPELPERAPSPAPAFPHPVETVPDRPRTPPPPGEAAPPFPESSPESAHRRPAPPRPVASESYFNPPHTIVIPVPEAPEDFKAAVEADGIPSQETIRQMPTASTEEYAQPAGMSISPVMPGYMPDTPIRIIPIAQVEPASTLPQEHPEAGRGYFLDSEGVNIWRDLKDKGKGVEPRGQHGYSVAVEDPFADPVPAIAVSRPEGPGMPEPARHEQERHGMPVPDQSTHSVHHVPSLSSFLQPPSHAAGASTLHEIDETQPLLAGPHNSSQSYLNGNAHANASFFPTAPTANVPRFHQLGWLEYALPDGTVYYVHPTLRVTTDVNLRDGKKLDLVTAYFDLNNDNTHERWGGKSTELWMVEGKARKGKEELKRFWVDHGRRQVKAGVVWDSGKSGARTGRVVEEDALDMEYRYWGFLEGHPLHVGLPNNARREAMDVLTWAWTDRLLPSQRALRAPFTQEECQELMRLLRSFGDNQADPSLQAVVQTRIVARVLMRTAQWRQQHFRPHKPLPQDISTPRHGAVQPHKRKGIPRLISDVVLSCVCLGIPYLLFTRSTTQHFRDEESLRLTPTVVASASTCLVAAIVLSTSVTFLSLPTVGLDPGARLAGLVAALFAAFSIGSYVLVSLRVNNSSGYGGYRDYWGVGMGGEGMVDYSARHIILSLPAVFLAYSVIALLVGIVMYALKVGGEEEDWTTWSVLGLLGGLAGVLVTTFLLLFRR